MKTETIMAPMSHGQIDDSFDVLETPLKPRTTHGYRIFEYQRVLAYLAKAKECVFPDEIATALKLSVPSVHVSLNHLKSAGCVEKMNCGRYGLTSDYVTRFYLRWRSHKTEGFLDLLADLGITPPTWTKTQPSEIVNPAPTLKPTLRPWWLRLLKPIIVFLTSFRKLASKLLHVAPQ